MDAGWTRVPVSANFAKQKISIPTKNIKDAGYMFVYLSYENQSNNYIYFDDFKVTHTKTSVIQYNEYYAHGSQTASSWTRENVLGNNFLSNGSTELNTTTNLFDLDFRNFDPILGRMHGVYPVADKYSSFTPYNFAFNDPVSFNDPSGADPAPENTSNVYYYVPYSPYYTGYTYDDRVDYHPMGDYVCGQCWRDEQGRNFLNSATGYGPSLNGGFNAWVNSMVRANNIVNGIASALNSKFGGSVNVTTGAVSMFNSYNQARNAGSLYIQSNNGWGYIEGGRDGFLERAHPEGTVIRNGIYVDATIADRYDAAVAFLMQSKKGAAIISFLQGIPGLEVWGLNEYGNAVS